MMKDIQEVSAEFSLKVHFVRKCLNGLQLLKPHIHIGDKNKRLLDDQGCLIFAKIAELKAQNLAFPEIQRQIDGIEPPVKPLNPPDKPPPEPSENLVVSEPLRWHLRDRRA